MSKNKSSTAMTHVACESKLLLVVRSSMHPFSGNWVAVGHMVVYYAGLGTHLLQELNDSTVAHSMPNALYFSTEPSDIDISIFS